MKSKKLKFNEPAVRKKFLKRVNFRLKWSPDQDMLNYYSKDWKDSWRVELSN